MKVDILDKAPMSCTVLINGSFAGSLINFRGSLISALVARGHRVCVSAPNFSTEQVRQLRELGAEIFSVTLERTGRRLAADIRYLFDQLRLTRQIRPDVVINYTIKPNIWGTMAARMSGAQSFSMVTGLGYAFIPGPGLSRNLTQRLVRLLYRQATRCNRKVIFQNPDDVRDFVEAGCLIDRGKATIVNGSGVDLTRFAPAELPDNPVFLLIARLLVTKGVRDYADAALQLIEQGVPARFQIAGFIDHGPDAIGQHEVDNWVKGGIEFLGPLEDVRPALRQCSAFVLPSYREGTPRTVLEAMATGRPVITTDAPGCRETVAHGLNGLLVPVADSGALARAMRQLAVDPIERISMAKESLRLVQEKYDVTRVNAEIIEICDL